MTKPEFYIAVYKDGSIRKFNKLEEEMVNSANEDLSVKSKLQPFYEKFIRKEDCKETTKQRLLFLYSSTVLYNEGLNNHQEDFSDNQLENAVHSIKCRAIDDVSIFLNVSKTAVRDKLTRDLNIYSEELDVYLKSFLTKRNEDDCREFVRILLDSTFSSDLLVVKSVLDYLKIDYI